MFTWLAIRIAVCKYDAVVPALATAPLATIGGFVSFFLTFFVNQTYTRFNNLYFNSMTLTGRLHTMILVGRNHLPKEEIWRFMRYINVIHILVYVGLSETYHQDNFLLPMNDIQKLLQPAELARLQEIGVNSGGAAANEVIGWALQVIYRNRLPPLTEDLMVKELMTLRGCVATFFHYEDQPLPYPYLHLLYF